MTTQRVSDLTERTAAAFRSYQGGDESALGELVDIATPVLWQVARSCGLDQGTAEDVVQTTWLRLYEHATGITQPIAVLAWLVTTTRRESWRVSRTTSKTVPADLEISERGNLEPVAMAAVPDPEHVALLAVDDRLLWEHVTRLTPRCQQLVRVICFADSPNYAALSESLGMPVGSIGPTRGRCLATLRKSLQNDPKWSKS